MILMKTKDVSEYLGVSQTNIKRWASHYPLAFNKNHVGHYVFTEQEVQLLLYIKNQISQGKALHQISLPVEPVLSVPSPLPLRHMPSKPRADQTRNDMISRIREVERSLQQKADEVVTFQVLQHRAELEELRGMIEQIAVSVEKMQKPGVDRFTFQEGTGPATVGITSAASSAQKFIASAKAQEPLPPIKKRGFFRSFF
jgi:chromosome-anchoring protein RacA